MVKIVLHSTSTTSEIFFFKVVCHDIILATADDPATQLAARKASFLALDALEGDADFLTRTCSCRLINDAKKKVKSMQQQMKELENSEGEAKP